MDPDLTPNCTATALADVEKSMQSSQIALQLLTLLFSILSIAFTYLSTSRFRSSPLPKNLRILMGFHHIALLVYTIPFSLNQGYHLVTRIFYSDCALLVPVSRCVVLRIFQSAASVFFQFFYIAVLLNTFLNSFKFWSESQHSKWLGFLCWIIAGYATFPSVAVDHESKEFMLNCSSFEHKRNSVQKMIFLRPLRKYQPVSSLGILRFSQEIYTSTARIYQEK
ncbi:hypothetical protein GCK72_012306 [Caenorhabditis remanei]|uniref:G-protein coupled receptors family 1 profile domain-containing protein n=1 Tax=Caenorhabditis remanei TaxID=31234 RepID=A0A6A5GMT5_CAERE|nr:hypothetical protein GCK72_012306 [Caenorhabditis remanei]KAF1755855.1 hypothetical protein GCK72_012306 [Caenorhabditis remanei]